MQLGIFAKTFVRPTLGQIFATVKKHGLDCVQFNFSCVGLPTLPEAVDATLAQLIRDELQQHGLFMAAISGTCNLIHPRLEQRAKDISRLAALIRSCRVLGTSVVTLCTGSRDPDDMWRAHRENQSPVAWKDLVDALEQLLPVAQQHAVVLGVEPEPANVIDSADRARALLDEMQSPCLKIVFDAANLLQPHTLTKQKQILSRAFALLGADIVLAHAKDLTTDTSSGTVAAGRGALDYNLFLSSLANTGFDGPLILHGLQESEVGDSVAFIQKILSHPQRRT